MNKIYVYLIVCVSCIGSQNLYGSSSQNINWQGIISALQSTQNIITHLQQSIHDSAQDLGTMNDYFNPMKNSLSSFLSSYQQKASSTTNSDSTQELQSASTTLINAASLSLQLCGAMADTILTNATAITSSSDPLNADLVIEQTIQDTAFVINNILVYLASQLATTPQIATTVYKPQVSCSDTLATSILAMAGSQPGATQTSLINALLTGSVQTTLPTSPINFPVTPLTIYAAVCAFVNLYDANSTSGPYQSVITDMISVNNTIQTNFNANFSLK